MYRIGIDVGGTKINVGIFNDEDKSLIVNKRILVKDVKCFCESVNEVVEQICRSANINRDQIVSCGIGIPGTISDDGRRILKAPNIAVLDDNVAEQMENKLGVPVVLVQDSRAAALGEYISGGYEKGTLICVAIGTGLGTGIVVDGKIYNGSLGCAGEMGHICVVEGGRECGCGKRGCLEKYAAGGGLDITARELLGDGKTAYDLFEAAKVNEAARLEIEKAAKLVGSAVVSMVNLLSPMAILFSGGIGEREEYVGGIIDYVSSHCYSAGKLPEMRKATLGDLAPLYGAAFVCDAKAKRRAPELSASIMCADLLNMGKALKEIEDAGIKYLHCDIMDNHFVPNLMLPMELLNKLRPATNLPFDIHIMAENPETIIEKLILKEGDFVSIHYESTVHLQRAISLVKAKGAKAAVALNPATPISVLEEILPELDMILIMSVNPGFAGQSIVPTSFDKLRRTREMLTRCGYSNVLIQVDGNCSFENVPKMYDAGADIFVVGTSSVFKKGLTVKEGSEKLFALLNSRK